MPWPKKIKKFETYRLFSFCRSGVESHLNRINARRRVLFLFILTRLVVISKSDLFELPLYVLFVFWMKFQICMHECRLQKEGNQRNVKCHCSLHFSIVSKYMQLSRVITALSPLRGNTVWKILFCFEKLDYGTISISHTLERNRRSCD